MVLAEWRVDCGGDSAQWRLTAPGDAPVVVGSTLHITMGEADVAAVDWTDGVLTLHLTDAGAREGRLFVVCEGTPVLRRTEGLAVDSITPAEGCWTISITSRRRGAEQSVMLDILE